MNRLRLQSLSVLSILVVVSCSLVVSAKTFYVDPSSGNLQNDGSSNSPWKTLQEVVDSGKINTREPVTYPYQLGQPLKEKNAGAPVKAGDTILLRTGYHGIITVSRMFNSDWITIAAQTGHKPQAHHILVQAACKWRIRGLTISPELGQSVQKITLITVESHNWSGPVREIEVEECLAYSALDVNTWDTTTWIARACNGIEVQGRQIVIRNNKIKNVDFGISVSDDSVIVEGNEVDRFDGDGLRGVANDLIFRNNVIKNCIVARSANHDDGFQSWSLGTDGVGTGTVYRVKLIGNIFINNTDPSMPLKGTMQGIGCFDGMFEDWDIVNNVVITDHWHGVTLLGARNCRIVNNTVCDINTVSPGPPWIKIAAHKNGTLPQECVVRNNLTTALSIDTGRGMVSDHNIIIKNTADYFIDYSHFNLSLKAGCLAIDSGSTTLAPSTDIFGTTRPRGKTVDIGAYEYLSGNAVRRVQNHRGAGFPPFLISISGSFIRIVNNVPGFIRVRLVGMDGKTIQDFGELQGRNIQCILQTPAAGIRLLKISSADQNVFQTLFVR